MAKLTEANFTELSDRYFLVSKKQAAIITALFVSFGIGTVAAAREAAKSAAEDEAKVIAKKVVDDSEAKRILKEIASLKSDAEKEKAKILELKAEAEKELAQVKSKREDATRVVSEIDPGLKAIGARVDGVQKQLGDLKKSIDDPINDTFHPGVTPRYFLSQLAKHIVVHGTWEDIAFHNATPAPPKK